MEMLKVELYNKGLKIDIEEDAIEISVENAKKVMSMLNADEVFDSLKMYEKINPNTFKEKVLDEYPEQFENLLNEFFNQKSDSNKYLTAEQQEEMESEFYDFINQYNQ